MKIEVLCPTCGSGYLVDETDLEAGGGTVPCASCGALIRFKRSVKPARPAAGSRPAPRKPPIAAVPEPEKVICPRCRLHFEPRKERDAAKEGSRRTVLVVEDMEYFRTIAKDALKARYEVKTASNVADAFEILYRGGIDLLVLDLTLDGGNHGLRILMEKPKPCPILVFTTEDESELYGEQWDQLQALGADDILIKGMHVDEALVKKVAEMLGESADDDLAV